MKLLLERLTCTNQSERLAHKTFIHCFCRRRTIFYQSVLGDFNGALSNVSDILQQNGLNLLDLQNRALLNILCNNLQGALDDLNTALQLISESPRKQTSVPGYGDFVPGCIAKPHFLSFRGYVKDWIGDYTGAKGDYEAAVQSKILLDASVVINDRRVNYQILEKLSYTSIRNLVNLTSLRLF